MHALNTKERKQFYEKLHEYFGTKYFFSGMLFVSGKNKFYVINDKYKEVISLKINTKVLGLYIAEINEFGEIRLSIEGSQLVGPHATKHVLELSAQDAVAFSNGKDIPIQNLSKEYFIISVKDATTGHTDYLGCGKVKEGILLNFTPKGRRVV